MRYIRLRNRSGRRIGHPDCRDYEQNGKRRRAQRIIDRARGRQHHHHRGSGLRQHFGAGSLVPPAQHAEDGDGPARGGGDQQEQGRQAVGHQHFDPVIVRMVEIGAGEERVLLDYPVDVLEGAGARPEREIARNQLAHRLPGEPAFVVAAARIDEALDGGGAREQDRDRHKGDRPAGDEHGRQLRAAG
ncbi:conserved hypothetical protein, partial [Ricinus communis]